jgi:2-C-methyl-D-erythritol 4-phosphate cytidylyltransferase
MKAVAIIPAAGLGTRMGKTPPEHSGMSRKQFMLLDGDPVAIHTIRKFVASQKVSSILVAMRAEDMGPFQERLRTERYSKQVLLVEGGRNRQESVGNCLAQISEQDADLVAVHDAVRPFVTVAQIDECIEQAARDGAVILAIPPVDTIKQVSRTVIRSTLSRERIVLAQTPQVFRTALLKRAFSQAEQDGFTGTDEASLVEHLGEDVQVVMGSDRNIKITRPSDMALARLFYDEERQQLAEAAGDRRGR